VESVGVQSREVVCSKKSLEHFLESILDMCVRTVNSNCIGSVFTVRIVYYDKKTRVASIKS
jgi:hypothetical protein